MPIESVSDRRSLLVDDGVTAVVGEVSKIVGFPYKFPVIFGARETIKPERNINGLFSKSYYESHDVESYLPSFLIVDEDAQEMRHSHKLALLGTVYSIVNIKPDGEGFTLLLLRELDTYNAAIDARRYPYTMADFVITENGAELDGQIIYTDGETLNNYDVDPYQD